MRAGLVANSLWSSEVDIMLIVATQPEPEQLVVAPHIEFLASELRQLRLQSETEWLFVGQVRAQRGRHVTAQRRVFGLQLLHTVRIGVDDVDHILQGRALGKGFRGQIDRIPAQPMGRHAAAGRDQRHQEAEQNMTTCRRLNVASLLE